MKSLLSIRHLFKLNSSRIIDANFDLTLTYGEAVRNAEVIALASSTTLRMIDNINGKNSFEKEKEIKELKEKKKELLNKKNTRTNKIKIKEINEKIHKEIFIEDYLCVVMDTKGDYDKVLKHFKVNGIEYQRLLSTSGGVKKSVIVFCSTRVHDKLYSQLNAERNPNIKFVPAKLEAYISLACSASFPVSKPNGILVVGEPMTHFKEDVIEVNGQGVVRPNVRYVDDYEIEHNACDGMGLMLPSLAKRWSEEVQEDYMIAGCCLRQAFTKGMIFTFDFHQFADEVAHYDIVTDVWGNQHNIKDIELILTTSMLKLWSSYDSVDDWLEKTLSNDHTFAITKITPEKLDEEQTLNYQFLQSLELSDEDIEELCKPFLDTIDGIMNKDYRQSLLYLRGVDLKEKSVLRPPFDFTTAMMLDESMLNDPYVYSKIKHNITNRIDRAKMGVLPVRGNFSIISGDPYLLCEYVFGFEPTGLLKKGEFYSKFWNDKGVKETIAMRAPMTSHNNIQQCKMVNDERVNKWFKYMDTVFILNAWDSTCDKLNGADKDGDTFFTTDNPVILRNVHFEKPIMCIQSASSKIVPKEKDFVIANKRSFGNMVGTITNYATSMYTVIINFEEGTPEWNELHYRITCMQDFQQNSIDLAKGIEYRPVPKEWYDYKINKIREDDDEETIKIKEFNQRILANKKPYFMIYNYDKLKAEYGKYYRANNEVCKIKFNMTVEELRDKQDKTEEEQKAYEAFALGCPVNVSPSVINRIAWHIEKHFADKSLFKIESFDKEKLKTPNINYSTTLYNKVKILREEYSKMMDVLAKASKESFMDGDSFDTASKMLQEDLIYDILVECKTIQVATNVLVDICYADNKSKDLLWELCAEQMIKNLIANGYDKLHFPIKDEDGDITFKGIKFRMEEVDANGINWK